MTKEQAQELAKLDPTYRARKLRGEWCVWCDASDHVVDFDRPSIRNLHKCCSTAAWRA